MDTKAMHVNVLISCVRSLELWVIVGDEGQFTNTPVFDRKRLLCSWLQNKRAISCVEYYLLWRGWVEENVYYLNSDSAPAKVGHANMMAYFILSLICFSCFLFLQIGCMCLAINYRGCRRSMCGVVSVDNAECCVRLAEPWSSAALQ